MTISMHLLSITRYVSPARFLLQCWTPRHLKGSQEWHVRAPHHPITNRQVTSRHNAIERDWLMGTTRNLV
jgi:hypothetical protein